MELATNHVPAPAIAQDVRQLHGTLRLRLWIEDADGVCFGLGRLMLLREVANAGSLKAAAERLGMSYRAAWGKIKSTEKILGMSLVEKSGCNRSGYHLTACGEAFCQQYENFFNEVEQFALRRSHNLPLFDLHGYEQSK